MAPFLKMHGELSALSLSGDSKVMNVFNQTFLLPEIKKKKKGPLVTTGDRITLIWSGLN